MVYEPLEDSFLMQRWVERLVDGKSVLDVGTGSGIQAITAYNSGAKKVVAVDIDKKAIVEAKANAKAKNVVIDFRVSDLFNNIAAGEKFDIIIFNPPYLPADDALKNEGVDLSGGEIGNELGIKLLKFAKKYLTNKGFILLICSSLSNPFGTFNEAKLLGYNYEILEDLTLNMETLYCVKFMPVNKLD